MKIYSLKRVQSLPISRAEAWAFFTDPLNLSKITPESMSFEILSELPEKIYSGLIIEYFVRPIPGLRVRWITEIKHVEEGKFFIDEQRFGPYKFWYHKHTFESSNEGALMTDEVIYALPFGFLGRLFGSRLVANKLKTIFDYRYKVLKENFG
ncbi:MAG: SRPBCC family protein [Chloroflexota bacterium]